VRPQIECWPSIVAARPSGTIVLRPQYELCQRRPTADRSHCDRKVAARNFEQFKIPQRSPATVWRPVRPTTTSLRPYWDLTGICHDLVLKLVAVRSQPWCDSCIKQGSYYRHNRNMARAHIRRAGRMTVFSECTKIAWANGFKIVRSWKNKKLPAWNTLGLYGYLIMHYKPK